MRAVRFYQYGGPEVLGVEEVPDPTPRAHELLLKVEAAGINRADLLLREGRYASEAKFPAIAGLEVCGEVIGMGETVQGFALGERVCGLLPGGGYAEKVAMAAPMAMHVPDRLAGAEAASIPVVFYTAWQTLIARAQLQPGESVLIHAAGSGVGVAGIQLAKHFGAKVITTAGSAEKLRRAAALGADVGIDYNESDFSAAVLKATEGKGVDVILDGVGGATFPGNLACLAPRGRLVIIGQVGGGQVNLDLGQLLGKNMALHGFYLAGLGRALFPLVQQFQKELLPLFAEGRLRPVVDRTFPLAEAAEAHRYVAGRQNFGKVVLVT